MIRAVLDANVLISSVIGPLGASRRIYDAGRNDEFVLLISPGILEEVARKLAHPRIRDRYHVGDDHLQGILSVLRAYAETFSGTAPVSPGSRDPSDDMILATAGEGQAEFIVTGDKDLLELKSYEQSLIVTPAGFVAILDEQRAR